MHGAIAMGRPKKSGPRHTCGKLVQPKDDPAVRDTVLAQPHRRWLAEDKRDDRKAGYELGRLRLAKRITFEQYAAGMRFGRLALRMLRAIDAPSRTPGNSIAGHIASDPSDIVEDAPKQGVSDEEAMVDYKDAKAAVIDAYKGFAGDIKGETHGRMVLAELHNVTVHDRSTGNFMELSRGLHVLEQHWRKA